MATRRSFLAGLLAAFLLPVPLWAESESPPGPLREKDLPRHILRDQKFFWLRPFRAQRQDLATWTLLAGGTAVLLPLDSPAARGLAVRPPGDGFDFSRRVGQLSGGGVDFAVAGGFYLFGRLRHDERARETGLLGAQAVADALIITELLKTAAGRSRPTRNRGRELIDDADGEFAKARRSFPSGHALQAWALATVIGEEYRHNPWVRYSAFSLAGFVSVARVTGRKHFPSDVFVGSILGYLVGRHVFQSHHRVSPSAPPASLPVKRATLRWHVGPGSSPVTGQVALALTFQF
ncbi:MAG: phosphatase PAP2 family protein [Terriglobia bacterium]